MTSTPFRAELFCKPGETIRFRVGKGTLDYNVLTYDPPTLCHQPPNVGFPDERVLGDFRGGFQKNAYPLGAPAPNARVKPEAEASNASCRSARRLVGSIVWLFT